MWLDTGEGTLLAWLQKGDPQIYYKGDPNIQPCGHRVTLYFSPSQ